jgi:hypothetical protein
MIEVVQGLSPNIGKDLDQDQESGVVQGRDQDQEKGQGLRRDPSLEDPDQGEGQGHGRGQSQGPGGGGQGENIKQCAVLRLYPIFIFSLRVFDREEKKCLFIYI